MSLLAIQLSPRNRWGPRTPAPVAGQAPGPQVQWAHVYSADGLSPGPLRLAPATALPKADQVVLVLSAADVSWHRARLPKAAAARMRMALLGTLEEQLLEEEDLVHLALAAGASPGQDGWVAAAHAPHLVAALAALESAGVHVARVASALPPPGGPLRAHFSTPELAAELPWTGPDSGFGAATAQPAAPSDNSTWWTLSAADGAWHLPLPAAIATTTATSHPVAHGQGTQARMGGPKNNLKDGDLASALRHTLPEALPGQRWTCTPAAAAAAERFMGRPVPVQTAAEHLLEAATSATNLRQFELQPRHRGLAALRSLTQQLGRREWRTVRVGLWALAALQLLGLNAAAWSQQQTQQARRERIEGLLRTTFPDQRTVLDARAQMRTQTQKLRAAAGQPGPGDLEPALAAAAAAWPDGKPAVTAIRFEAGRLTLSSPGWAPEEVAALRQRLAAQGWAVEHADPLLTLQHNQAASTAATGMDPR